MFNSRTLLFKFFCLFLLVAFANTVNARQTIQAKNIQSFEKIKNATDEKKFTEAIELLGKLESKEGLNNLERAYIYTFNGNIASELGELEKSKAWYKKALSLDNDDLGKGLIKSINASLDSVQKKINIYQPKYNLHKHLLKKLDAAKKITDDHYTLALAAFKLSKESDVSLILNKVNSLYQGQSVLPERWMKLEASLTTNKNKKLELKKLIFKHYPSESNRDSLNYWLFKNASAALKKSDLTKSRSILKDAENLHQHEEILPERWMIFKTKLTQDKKEILELWKEIANHYPSKTNQRDLAAWYSKNGQKLKAYSIYIKLYNQGKLTTRDELEIASHSFSESGEPLKGALVLAKGFKINTIHDSRDNLLLYDFYFADAKKDKTITPQEWLEAGDKFVLYGDKDKAKVCFKKAKKDKALRDVAKQRLKELKQS